MCNNKTYDETPSLNKWSKPELLKFWVKYKIIHLLWVWCNIYLFEFYLISKTHLPLEFFKNLFAVVSLSNVSLISNDSKRTLTKILMTVI